MRSKLVLAAFIFLTVLPAVSQVTESAKVESFPLGVGGGVSDYNVDYGHSRYMQGFTAWVDYRVWKGLGIEAEGTTIFLNKPSSLTRMKQDTIKGGPIYKFPPFHGVRPYVKGYFGIADIDFPSSDPHYTSDHFSMYALGGGIEYRIWRSTFLRADWEYEAYRKFFGDATLNPNGFTVGAMYYFHNPHRHL